MRGETEKIKERYAKRKENIVEKHGNKTFIEKVVAEREAVYTKALKNNFTTTGNLKLIEIGAGAGANIDFFRKLRIQDEDIIAAELLPERAKTLREKFPKITVAEGDALQLNYKNSFDIVFQSLVFTSILDDEFRKKLAAKMWAMLKPGGIILWYDFRFNNPANRDVKAVTKTEIRDLFPQSNNISFTHVTLAPPIGRRIGGLYNFVNSVFPFLRTHLIAVIKK